MNVDSLSLASAIFHGDGTAAMIIPAALAGAWQLAALPKKKTAAFGKKYAHRHHRGWSCAALLLMLDLKSFSRSVLVFNMQLQILSAVD